MLIRHSNRRIFGDSLTVLLMLLMTLAGGRPLIADDRPKDDSGQRDSGQRVQVEDAEQVSGYASQRVLKSLAQFASHYGRTDIESIPVDLSVSINYWDQRDKAVFVQDQHDASYVDVSLQDFERYPEIEPGTRVRVKGHLLLDGHFVVADSVEVSEDVGEVQSKSVLIPELSLGDFWSHRVKTVGTVNEIAHFGHEWTASISSGDTKFIVHRFEEDKEYEWPALLGRRVRIRGTLTCEMDFNGHPFRYAVRMNEFDSDLRLTRTDSDFGIDLIDEDVFDLGDRSIESAIATQIERIRSLDPAKGNLFQVSGQITSADEHEGYLIEAGGHGMFVHSELAKKASLGHIVDLTLLRNGPNDFQAVALHSKAFQSVPPPSHQKAQLVDVAALPCRATIEGEFVSSSSQGNKRIITLVDGTTEFVAILEVDDEDWQNISLDNARQIAVSGMIVPLPPVTIDAIQGSKPAFAVELQNWEGLLIVSRWWQMSPSFAITALALIAAVCTAGMICFATLWLRLQHTGRENRQLAFQLVQSQKMDALGRLAGGVAHDFNNLLVGIASNLELMDQRRSTAGVERDQCLASARKCTNQATTLVRSLLGFSRQTNLKLEVGDINQAVGEAALLAKTSFSPNVSISLDLSKDLPLCRFDQTQLQQVFVNLFINARDALPDQTGTIYLKTVGGVDERSNPCAQILVRDYGEGMDNQTIARVFEPFFTTKKVGEGTGLGLALSYGIIKQHGGTIDCESELGLGSVFTITLPGVSGESLADAGRVDDAHVGPTRSLSAITSRGHRQVVDLDAGHDRETFSGSRSRDPSKVSWEILLVDDDDEVRRVTKLSLEALGHRVTDVAGGREALKRIEQGLQIDVVILDLIMPALSGNETFCRIKSTRPDLPIIVCSGLMIEVEKLRRLSGRSPDGCLSKPFQLADLKMTLEHVMQKVYSDAS